MAESNPEYGRAMTALLDAEGIGTIERDFLSQIYRTTTPDLNHARLLSEFRLVRALREEAAAREKYNRVMMWLTVALIFFACVEALSTLVQAMPVLIKVVGLL
mgnify:CR=1 FL=1